MENIKYDVNQEPMVTSKATFDILLNQENPSDLIALYHFYYYTAKWQRTDRPHATTTYVANGLKWSRDRVRKNKFILIELGFIEDFKTKNERTGKITGHFIKINFIWSRSHTPDIPESGIAHSLGNHETNSLITNNINALRTIKRKRLNYIVPPSNEGETVRDKNKTYLPIAKKLANLITSKKRVKINGQKLNGWANSIRLMVSADGINPARINDALDWYADHFTDDYVPVIESGSSLREKFLRLEAAIERGTNNRSHGSGFRGRKPLTYQKPKKV